MSSGQRLLVAMSRLQLAGEIGSALRDPKLNEVQLPGLVWGVARENPQQTFRLFQVRRSFILHTLFGNMDERIMQDSMVYFKISALSYPALALYNSGAAIFRSMAISLVACGSDQKAPAPR